MNVLLKSRCFFSNYSYNSDLSLFNYTNKKQEDFNVSKNTSLMGNIRSFLEHSELKLIFTFKSKELKLVAFSAVKMLDRFFALNPFFQLALEFRFVEDCPFFEQLATLFPVLWNTQKIFIDTCNF